MTTAPRPLPPGVEIRQFEHGWHPCCRIDTDGRCSVLSRSRNAWTHRYGFWTGDDGWPFEADATAAFWKHYDAQPENQPHADQKYASPGYRAGYAAGLASAEGVIATLTARVAALEGKGLPDGCSKVSLMGTTPRVMPGPPTPPEPVVGVVYRMADAQSDDSQRWKWIGEGKAASSWTPGVWLNPNEMLGAAVATLIRSGKLVPVTGKEGAQ